MLREIWYTFVEFFAHVRGAAVVFPATACRDTVDIRAPFWPRSQPSLQYRRAVACHHHDLWIFCRRSPRIAGLFQLSKFNAEDSVGTFAAFSLLKELGPVITALLFAGRAGTALTSEIGLMKATDQLAAMEMMAINPLRRVLVPRFIGGVISMPLLAAVFSVIGLFGAHIVAVTMLGVDAGAFWQQMAASLDTSDVYEGIIKSFVFGVVVSLLTVWEGYNAIPTAEGVGRATTRTVVISAIAILILDFMITAIAL